MKTVSLRLFLLASSLLMITIPAIVIGTYNTRASNSQINQTHEDELHDQLSLVKSQIQLTMEYTGLLLENNIRTLEVSLADLTGESVDWEGADEILKRFSAVSNTHYTVFLPTDKGIVRKITTVKDKNGQYATGTYIGTTSEVYMTVMAGNTYRGKALILDQWYSSIYMPVYDTRGELSHILFAGIPEEKFLASLLDNLSSRVIGDEGYFFILSPQGDYLLSKNRERDGESLINAQDSSGRFFIKEMIGSALKQEGVSIMHYPWQNAGEDRVREKIAAYTYIDNVDWILGSSDYLERAMALAAQTRRMLLITIAVAIMAGMGISLFLNQLIYNSFSRLKSNIGSVALGNLKAQDGASSFFREIDELHHSMHDNMLPKLKNLIGNMEDKAGQIIQMSEVLGHNINQTLHSIDQVNLSSEKVDRESENLTTLMSDSRKSTEAIAASVEEYQEMMHTQKDSVAEISASIEESGASLNNVSRVVTDKLDAAMALARQGEEGQKSVDITNELIIKIEDDVSRLLDILHIINDITDRTQLLAMNASIEAAHAGKQGRGFAIVAGEMRQLAESTSQNGRIIEETLGEITGRIKAASQHSDKTSQAMASMTDNLKDFTRAFREISDSTQEISLGTSQILDAAGMLSDLSEKNYHSSHQIKSSVEQLNGAVKDTEISARKNRSETENLKTFLNEVVMAQKEMDNLGIINRQIGKELTGELEKFVYDELTKDDSLIDMIRAHQLWMERAESHLVGKIRLNPEELCDKHSCTLGHWLDDISDKDLISSEEITQLQNHHEKLHGFVRELTLSSSEDVEKDFLHLKEHSHNVIRYLLASLQTGS